MSLIDTWAATGAGAFTLSENGLYTVEAWRIFLGRLSPEGVFTVSRWYAPGEVNETGRMVSLAVATLLDLGVTEPQRHLFLASDRQHSHTHRFNRPSRPTRSRRCRLCHAATAFRCLSVPITAPPSPVLESIVRRADRAGLNVATQDYYLDLTPPTDARPFFFNQLRFARCSTRVRAVHSTAARVMAGNLAATMTLAMLVMVSMGLVLATIVVPQLSNVRHMAYARDRRHRLLRADRRRLHDNRDRAPAADERIPGPSRLRARIVLFSLILCDRLRQPRLGAPAARRPPPAYRLGLATSAYLFALPTWIPPVLPGWTVPISAARRALRAGAWRRPGC